MYAMFSLTASLMKALNVSTESSNDIWRDSALGREAYSDNRSTDPNVIIPTARRNFEANTTRAKHVNEGFQYLDTEADAILDAAAPLVGTLVDSVVEELMDQIAICTVH